VQDKLIVILRIPIIIPTTALGEAVEFLPEGLGCNGPQTVVPREGID
jgi:hypothetical protein